MLELRVNMIVLRVESLRDDQVITGGVLLDGIRIIRLGFEGLNSFFF